MASVSLFEDIKKEYAELYSNLIFKKNLLRPTKVGYSGPASADSVFGLFKKMHLEKYRRFLDLGSGDGKVVLVASLFTGAAGIEFDEALVKTAKKIKAKLKIKNADFVKGNYLDIDISKYDILFINPDNPFYELEKKLRNEMDKKARLIVFGGMYRPLNMKLEKTYTSEGVKFFVYKNI